MNRREFLKMTMAASMAISLPTVAAIPSPKHFWMQTYGPHYDPSSFGFDWTKADSSLLGIYHGEELMGKKAIDCPIGTRIVLNDGKQYMCYGPNASEMGITIKGKGIFLNEQA